MNSRTCNVTLPEICSLVTDGTHDSPKLQNSGVPFVKGKHINTGRIDFENCDFIAEPDHEKCIKRVKPQLNDILLANIGASIGDCAVVKDSVEFSIKNLALLRPNPEKVDPAYLYHLVKSSYFKSLLSNRKLGAAQPYVSLQGFRSFEFEIIKNRKSQSKIGEVGNSYTDLIENNRRRIALLEQAARLLYKEWFVHLRFPGHEHVKIKDGLPEGWERLPLKDIALVNRASLGGSNQGEIEYIDISSVTPGVINETTTYQFSNAPSRARRVVRHGDIIWSCVRPNRKSCAVVWNPPENLIVSTGFAVLTPVEVPTSYLYQAVTTNDFVGYLTNNARGAAYPAVTSSDFENAILKIPNKRLLRLFNDVVEPISSQLHALSAQSKKLANARDLLLPRLMNGEIVV